MEVAGRERRILVVDDDPDTVLYLTSLLEDSGYQVESGNDQASALQALDAFGPDLVILDVIMPGRSGMHLLVRIREDERYAGLPLVVLTGDDGILQDHGRSYLGSHDDVRGPDAVLGKPIDHELLLATVQTLTGGRR